MKYIALLIFAALAACTHTEPTNVELTKSWQRQKIVGERQGIRDAKADVRRGALVTWSTVCEEEDGMRINWCYWKLLRDKYGVEYRWRDAAPAPGTIAYCNAYNSIMQPRIDAKLGRDWSKRIYDEAERYYRDRRDEVIELYSRDKLAGYFSVPNICFK